MQRASPGQVLDGLWRFEAPHPEWTEDQGGQDGWEQNVAWGTIDSSAGLILVDPLVSDWAALDQLVSDHRRRAGIVRTLHFHQRSIGKAARPRALPARRRTDLTVRT